jgi:DNA polymerase-1
MKQSFWSCDLSWICNLYYRASDTPHEALHTFILHLIKTFSKHRPTYYVAAIDSSTSFRKELDPLYKSNRPPKEPEYIELLKNCKEILNILGIHSIEVPLMEGDDVIASAAEKAKEIKIPFVACIQDKDFRASLRSGAVGMYNKPQKQPWRFFSQKMAEEDWGVRVDQFYSMQILWGDGVDCIRGCHQIGFVKSRDLLNRYDTIEGIYENLSELPLKMQENLKIFEERLDTVRQLVTLRTDVGDFSDLGSYKTSNIRVNKEELRKFLNKHDLSQMYVGILEIF